MKNEKPPKVDWVNEAWKEACNQVISDIRPRTDEERVSNPVNETPAKGGLTRFVTAEEAYQSDLARVSLNSQHSRRVAPRRTRLSSITRLNLTCTLFPLHQQSATP